MDSETMPPKTRHQEKKEEDSTKIHSAEAIMATLSRTAGTSTSLAPADHSKRASKANKASNASQTAPLSKDKPANNQNEIKDASMTVKSNKINELGNDHSEIDDQNVSGSLAEGGHNTGSTDNSNTTSTPVFCGAYADFIAFANANLPPPITDPNSATRFDSVGIVLL